jgi:primosomal replication protein N
MRRLNFETLVVAYGEVAAKLYQLPLPARITLKGYITPRSSRTQRLIVYITEFS